MEARDQGGSDNIASSRGRNGHFTGRSQADNDLSLRDEQQQQPRAATVATSTGSFNEVIGSGISEPIYLSAELEQKIFVKQVEKDDKPKKPLDVFFKEAVGLSQKVQDSGSEGESEEISKNLRKLEAEVRNLRDLDKNVKKDDGVEKDESSKPKGLYEMFRNKGASQKKSEMLVGGPLKMDDKTVYKELSPEMVWFATHLYNNGYFRDANFLPGNKFEVSCFENSYGRDFLKHAAEKFGQDHQEVAKYEKETNYVSHSSIYWLLVPWVSGYVVRWLSGSDLKTVTLFGCPSLSRKNVFSAKTLRAFFGIEESTVCCNCIFKRSCKFVNQSIWKSNVKNLRLDVVMRVITLYALDSLPPELVVPDEVKASVSKLLEESVNLSSQDFFRLQ
ncbi:hypothetical protein RJ639_018099 [Escallonia herrerae]|uniref:Uncharacterized protein n=1 Tax=Escallonia herrerae TaxID=1293975 RepID=A0AA89AI19_9ASTE|nr:hypothetical protein RJ639_018099 [Escallonia herrerae]